MYKKKFETGRGTVHNWQCDHMGHVNIRAYNELFEQSIWHAFNQMGITPTLLRNGEIAMATIEQNLRYLKELNSGDVVYIESYIEKITKKVVTIVNTLYNAETNEVCATCKIIAVCLDPITRKSRPFPEGIYYTGLALVNDEPEPLDK